MPNSTLVINVRLYGPPRTLMDIKSRGQTSKGLIIRITYDTVTETIDTANFNICSEVYPKIEEFLLRLDVTHEYYGPSNESFHT